MNEVRRLADDTLSHEKCPNARPMPEGRQCCSAIRSDQLSMTNFEQKKNDDPLDVHLAIRLEILAGIRGNIGSSSVYAIARGPPNGNPRTDAWARDEGGSLMGTSFS